MTYFDTSALLKLLVEEEGSELALLSWGEADLVLTSRLAYPEARAALAAATRAGRISSSAREVAKRALESLWRQMRVIEVSQGHVLLTTARASGVTSSGPASKRKLVGVAVEDLEKALGKR